MAVDHLRGRLMASAASIVHQRSPSGASALARWRPAFTVLLILFAVGGGALTTACASASKKPPVGTLEPDKFLWERGTKELNARHWVNSREYFRQLMDSYPQSPYRADAKLGLADSYLGEGSAESRVLAINEYREFLSFYPTHPRADYAQYKLGMAHYYQMSGPERDQTETREAVTELRTMVEHYPKSPLRADAMQHLREARDRLSDAEYRVAYFYVRIQKFPPAAIDRFTALLKEDPEYTRRDAVYFYLAQSLIKMKRPAEALPYLDRLVKEFEQSDYLADAKALAETLKADQANK
jgi:outer membrane protein assembly factor BamD